MTTEILNEHLDRYLHVYADCIPVKGALNTAIYDLTRKDIYTISSSYFDVFEQLREQKIAAILETFELQEDRDNFISFLLFLLENELAELMDSDEMSSFPPINVTWDTPSRIDNAIVDMRDTPHDFETIINQLDALGCQFLQLRFYSAATSLDYIENTLRYCKHRSIQGVDLLLKYNPYYEDTQYISLYENNPNISSMVIHSSPANRKVKVNWGYDGEMEDSIAKEILFAAQEISSCDHCGIINKRSLSLPDVKTYTENVLHNGCLNRKISIDEHGYIKNCPSMKVHYGRAGATTLTDVYNQVEFRKYWDMNKNLIKECCDCELRFVCTDCRAYLKDENDLYSKPAKCSYDPYTGQWLDRTA